MVHALVRIYKEEGLKALYSGIAPAVLRQASYGTIKIGTYQSFKRLCVDSPEEESLPVNVLCGVLSGVISSSIANPTDVLKIRMQAQGRIMQGGMIGNFIDIYQQEGTRGLWKGVSLTAQRAAIVVGVELPVYDLTKKHLIKSGHMGDTVYTHFVSSFVCGLAGALTSNPIDVVRTRMMNQRSIRGGTCAGYKGTLDCLLQARHVTTKILSLTLVCNRRLIVTNLFNGVAEQVKYHYRANCKSFIVQVRSGCAFMVHVCQDEHQLYNEFFTKPTAKLDELLEKLCLSLYDVLRPLIIHAIHLETLSELCGILKNEMLEDHVQNNHGKDMSVIILFVQGTPSALQVALTRACRRLHQVVAFFFSVEQLGAFAALVQQMLEDVQERLVYRTHMYIQSDIIGYNPAPGDLAYPDKLEMMEKIAQSLKEEQKKLPALDSSFSDIQLEDPDSKSVIKSGASEAPTTRSQATISPADLHGMWYPTVRRTLVCLSKLYRCIDRTVFQGLSQEALSACIQSSLKAADAIMKNKGTPEIKEHYIDSKKEVDRHLKSSCEHFIQQQTKLFVGKLEDLLTKVAALKTMASQGGPKYNLSQQPWAQPAKINDIVATTYKTLKTKLPATLQSMSLYLANKDTEFILFKPVRVRTTEPGVTLFGVEGWI
ncbi:UNVERIFIED_CONTAM: hypothetical protein FKN15_038118 [Acipenser sinensis]